MKAVLLPLLTSVFIPAIVSLVVALTISYVGPRFNFPVWKRQKRKEQQLAIAERFASLVRDPYISMNRHPPMPDAGQDKSPSFEHVAARLEQKALLMLICTLFEREETLTTAMEIATKTLSPSNDVESLLDVWTLRLSLLVFLFAEALEVEVQTAAQNVSQIQL